MGDGFGGEQVRGAHEHTDPRTPGGERCGEDGDHGGRPGVVDPAGEEHLEVAAGRRVGVEEVLEDGELRLPERKAGARADVASALGAFEDELSGAGGEKLA